MKKLSVSIILIAMNMIASGCAEYTKNPLSEVKEFYETPHQLRKMFSKEEEVTVRKPGEGSFSGGFFMFIGGVSGDYQEGTETKYNSTHIRFAWEIKDSTYIITTLPIEKVRIRLTTQAETPTVSFVLDEFVVNALFDELTKDRRYSWAEEHVANDLGRILKNYFDPNEAFSKFLAYAVFNVKSEDWPTNINLPINQDYNK